MSDTQYVPPNDNVDNDDEDKRNDNDKIVTLTTPRTLSTYWGTVIQ